MAKTVAEWRVIILAKKAGTAALSNVDSTSNVADWNLWVDVQAFCANALDVLFDFFKVDVDAAIAADKSHTLRWYVTKAKGYQHGDGLVADSDVYAVVDEDAMVVTSAAAIEDVGLNLVRVKTAKDVGDGVLGPLSGGELAGLTEYMKRVKDAGVRLLVTTGDGDDLKLGLKIYYDALVLDSDGARIDGEDDEPVKGAIVGFLKGMPFDGVFVLGDMVDAVEAVDGVKICEVVYAAANYAATPYVLITAKYTPDGGYLVLNEGFFDGEVEYVVG